MRHFLSPSRHLGICSILKSSRCPGQVAPASEPNPRAYPCISHCRSPPHPPTQNLFTHLVFHSTRPGLAHSALDASCPTAPTSPRRPRRGGPHPRRSKLQARTPRHAPTPSQEARRMPERLQKPLAIDFVLENRFPAVTPAHDVIHRPVELHARHVRHNEPRANGVSNCV